ncbi:MAG: cobalt-precorrin 5A hydrolase [Thermodesulfobacteriota bacterium]
MKIAILAVTRGGKDLGERLSCRLPGAEMFSTESGVLSTIETAWNNYDAIVCIMATGIVVRAMAPLCRDKRSDPCVLVLDEKGKFVISLLSGHLGGGNELALTVAEITGGQPVITTASDVTGHTALDLWARRNRLVVNDWKKLTGWSTRLVNGERLKVYCEYGDGQLPEDMRRCTSGDDADLAISHTGKEGDSRSLLLRPVNLHVGIGCNRNTPVEDMVRSLDELFAEHGLDQQCISRLATIDLKKDEHGLLELGRSMELELKFYNKDELNGVPGVSTSAAVLAATGAKGVAEPAALLSAADENSEARLIIRKRKWKDVTVAVAESRIDLVE